MATNTERFVYNTFGAPPLVQGLLVAAGSTTEIKQGELCYLDANTDSVTVMTDTDDNIHAIVIAKEEQKATDAARFLDFYIPRLGDVFEFALDSATAVKWGDELQMLTTSPTDTLKVSTTDAVAWAVDIITPSSGVTWPTVSKVRCMFKRAGAAALELPFIGTNQAGDAS